MNTGLRRRVGFTLLELLAVVTIIGLLAVLAVAKFGDSKRRAYLAAMKSDLHVVATTAESRFTSENSYVNMPAPRGSAGVTLTFVGSTVGWTATATHASLPGTVCTMNAGPEQSLQIDCR
jgi:prepilin-type N-terminal cleavage/methylation domain-containing protein